MKKKSGVVLAVLCWLGLAACVDNDTPGNGNQTEEPDEETYLNPVFGPVLADPTVIRSGDFFYAYGTEDNWGAEGGYKLVPVIRSSNLVDWEFASNAFQLKPSWKEAGGIWAPCVAMVDGKYHLYYSFSTWGDPNPGIGLAIADKPTGPFSDQGKLFLSEEIGVANSIDPFFIETDEGKFLFWGSFHGIYAVGLSEDGRQVKGEKKLIAHSHLEAPYVYKKDDYYYFFGSAGSCCEGAASTYHVIVGRSSSLMGPYLDKNGNDLAKENYGELLIKGNTEDYGFAGPGHNAEIITDDEGSHWFLYHAIPKNNPRLANGTNRRSLLLDRLSWEDGWPVITNQQPGLASQKRPVFK